MIGQARSRGEERIENQPGENQPGEKPPRAVSHEPLEAGAVVSLEPRQLLRVLRPELSSVVEVVVRVDGAPETLRAGNPSRHLDRASNPSNKSSSPPASKDRLRFLLDTGSSTSASTRFSTAFWIAAFARPGGALV